MGSVCQSCRSPPNAWHNQVCRIAFLCQTADHSPLRPAFFWLFKMNASYGSPTCSPHAETCKCEMWSWGTNVLAFQFHPEMPKEMALEKIHPALTQIGRLNAEEQEGELKS